MEASSNLVMRLQLGDAYDQYCDILVDGSVSSSGWLHKRNEYDTVNQQVACCGYRTPSDSLKQENSFTY